MKFSMKPVIKKLLNTNLSVFNEFHPIRLELKRTTFSSLFALGMFLLGATFLFISENNYTPSDALYDRFLNNIPHYEYLTISANALTMTELGLSILFMVTLPRPWNVIIIRRAAVVLSTLFLTRGIFIVMTTIPSPLGKACVPDIIKDEYAIVRVIQLIIGAHSNCTDNVFSGHTSTILTACMQIHFYCKYNILRIISWMLSIAAILLVLISRLHYTVDVLCAVVIALLMHYLFVIAIDSDPRFAIVRFIKYLDGYDIRTKYFRNLRAASGDDLTLELVTTTASPRRKPNSLSESSE
eukprot:NODE_243_length_13055_cov_0.283498.p5 type:complete len:297 gc:universal NODE_243_length_13055_cov_0.283498:9555-10445(+)